MAVNGIDSPVIKPSAGSFGFARKAPASVIDFHDATTQPASASGPNASEATDVSESLPGNPTSSPDAKLLFPFSVNVESGILTLYAPSRQDRKDWIDVIDKYGSKSSRSSAPRMPPTTNKTGQPSLFG